MSKVKVAQIKEPNRFLRPVDSTSDAVINMRRSVEKWGLLQPIVVRKINKSYEVIDGLRRLSVWPEDKIEVKVVEATDLQAECMKIGLNANGDTSSQQFTTAILCVLANAPYWTLKDTADNMGVCEAWLLDVMGLQKGLHPEVLEGLANHGLYLSNGYSLLKLRDKNSQYKLLDEAKRTPPQEFAPKVMQLSLEQKKK